MENLLPKDIPKRFLNFSEILLDFFSKNTVPTLHQQNILQASKSQKFEIDVSLTRRRPTKPWNEVVEDLEELKASKELAKHKCLKVIHKRPSTHAWMENRC